ncbi:DNA alkylation repair protein [Litorisediminicola beolgyonensis]|uniref:DNA alkylation repair protein n=1 Tax=Litorisediminicola beolgyonensis TaxID=1173614 RepID=A0ABW3ZMM8_9RHOB
MTPDAAIAALEAAAVPGRAGEMAAYHKTALRRLGTPNPEINALSQEWRRSLPLDARLALADGLWRSGVFEASIAAAKLLTQARIPEDTEVWRLIASWVPEFDGWAIADHVASAGGRRLAADPSRLDEVETWLAADHLWTRRAALVFTLPFAKGRHPDATTQAVRDRVLGWAEQLLPDRAWFIQKAIAWWLRELSKHDPDRVRAFLDTHGTEMKAFARKDAARLLPATGA